MLQRPCQRESQAVCTEQCFIHEANGGYRCMDFHFRRDTRSGWRKNDGKCSISSISKSGIRFQFSYWARNSNRENYHINRVAPNPKVWNSELGHMPRKPCLLDHPQKKVNLQGHRWAKRLQSSINQANQPLTEAERSGRRKQAKKLSVKRKGLKERTRQYAQKDLQWFFHHNLRSKFLHTASRDATPPKTLSGLFEAYRALLARIMFLSKSFMRREKFFWTKLSRRSGLVRDRGESTVYFSLLANLFSPMHDLRTKNSRETVLKSEQELSLISKDTFTLELIEFRLFVITVHNTPEPCSMGLRSASEDNILCQWILENPSFVKICEIRVNCLPRRDRLTIDPKVSDIRE